MLPSTAIPLQQTQWRRKLGLDYLRIQKLRPHCEQNDYAHVVVQWPNRVLLSATPWTAARQASLSFTISRSLPKFMSIALVMPSSHLILWCPLFPLPSIFPSIRDFSKESAVPWQNTGVSTSTSVLPTSIQGWSLLRLTGLVFLLSKGLSGIFSSTILRRHQSFGAWVFPVVTYGCGSWVIKKAESWRKYNNTIRP